MFPYFELSLGCIKKSCRTINNSYRIWLVVGTFKREMNVHFTKFKVGKVFQDLSWANVFSGPCLKCTCMYTWCSLLFSLLFKPILHWDLKGQLFFKHRGIIALYSGTLIEWMAKGLAKYVCCNKVSSYRGSFQHILLLLGWRRISFFISCYIEIHYIEFPLYLLIGSLSNNDGNI